MPPSIEAQVEFIAAAIEDAEKVPERSKAPIESTHEAEREYSALCEKLAETSLFWKAEVSRVPIRVLAREQRC